MKSLDFILAEVSQWKCMRQRSNTVRFVFQKDLWQQKLLGKLMKGSSIDLGSRG